jgi:hypothetical protein
MLAKLTVSQMQPSTHTGSLILVELLTSYQLQTELSDDTNHTSQIQLFN